MGIGSGNMELKRRGEMRLRHKGKKGKNQERNNVFKIAGSHLDRNKVGKLIQVNKKRQTRSWAPGK